MLEKLKHDRKNLRKVCPRNSPRYFRKCVKTLCLGCEDVCSILSSPVIEKSCKCSVYKAFLLVSGAFGASGFCTKKSSFSENLSTNLSTEDIKKDSL